MASGASKRSHFFQKRSRQERAAKKLERAQAKVARREERATRKLERPRTVRESFYWQRERVWQKKRARRAGNHNPHQSFRRSYREDYYRPLDVPGLTAHAFNSFRIIGRHWKTFLCLLIFAVVANVCLVGLMSEETYVTLQEALADSETEVAGGEIGDFASAVILLVSTVSTGGLSTSSETATIFLTLMFLLVWLVTVWLVRYYLVGQKPKLRDALYQACAPIISTLAVLFLIIVELIPVFVTIVVYSAAVSTGFLETPFYALLVFVFALAMVSLSAYLVPSTVMALAAVTAPGLYPWQAVKAAGSLMQGRRMRLVLRVLHLLLVVALLWFVIMVPIILLDMWAKAAWEWLEGWPIVSVALLVMTCFTFIYVSVYVYLFYREVLASDQRLQKRHAASSAADLRAEVTADGTELLHTVADSQDGTVPEPAAGKPGTQAVVPEAERGQVGPEKAEAEREAGEPEQGAAESARKPAKGQHD